MAKPKWNYEVKFPVYFDVLGIKDGGEEVVDIGVEFEVHEDREHLVMHLFFDEKEAYEYENHMERIKKVLPRVLKGVAKAIQEANRR